MSLRRRALFLAGLLAAVSCSDAGDPVGPDRPELPAPEPGNVLQALDCTVTVSSRSLTCASAVPGTGAASGLIVGGQNLYVRLASTGMAVVPGDTFTFNATVQNLLTQALGVEDDGTADVEGVRVFFHSGPNAVGSGGPIVVAGASGEEVFINDSRPYYQYDGALETDEVSEPRQWKFALNGATQFNFKVYVSARVKYPQGWVDITPDSALLQVGETAVLADSVFDVVGRGISDDVTWSSSNPAVVTVTETSDSTAQIEGVSQGTAWVKAQSIATPVRSDSILVTVDNAPVLNPDSISAISNVTMPVDSANGMLANDGSDEPLTVTAGAVSTDQGGTATLSANGSFTYLSKPGYAGLDTIRYTVSDGTRTLPGKAVVRVEDSNYWFVQAGASGDGRDSSPFGTLAAAQDSAVAGDTIIVLANGVQQVDGAVTLEANQAVIGAGTSQAIERGLYNGASITVLAAGGSAPALTNTAAGATITLGTGNVIRGVGITAADGAAISGTSFGTLYVRDAGVNPAGPALLLSTGAVDAVFDVLSSTGSNTTGLSLTDVTGTLTSTGGAISGAVGTAFHVSGGSADFTYGGSISNAAGLAAAVSGRTGGALDVSGDITDSAGGISVTGISGGSVGFSGALSLTGSGVGVGSNTGGTISFTGSSKTISTGTNAGVSLTGNTGAAVRFGGGGLDVTTTSGAGFTATGGGTVTVTGAGNTVESTTGTAVTLDAVGTDAGGVNFVSVSADGAPNGIVLSGVTGGGLQVTGDGATAGSGGTVQNTTSHAVSLGTMTGADSVNLRFMTVGGGNAGTAGIFGSDFGTLRVTGVSVSTTGGPALSLASGTLNGGFSSLGSASSASNGVILTSTNGSFTAAAGTITGAASTALAVVGGSVTATIGGSVSQENAAPVVAVSGSHSGALTFETGTVSATNGTGLQFNNAVGTYAFNGTTTLNGGDAAIDITNSSTGSFTFGTGASVTSPTGSAFTVYGSSPNVTYSGNLTKGNAGLLVEIGEQPGGSVTFATGTLSATAGLGISLSNADGTVAFNGTTTLNGGDAGVDVVSGSSGAISFGTGASIANASGIALRVQNGGSSTNVAFAGGVASSATGLAVHVEGVSGGSVTASGAISGSNGILVQNNTGGTITFSGAKSLNTAANNAVTLATNTGATVDFTNGNNDITTTTGTAFTATGGGTVNVSGGASDISTGTGNALTLNAVTLGASGITFATVNTGAATAPVSLTNVAVTSGSAVTVGGGTIPAAAGTRFAVSGGGVNVDWAGAINQSTHNNPLISVAGGHTGTLAFSGALSATSGTGLQFDNADGTYNLSATTTLNGGDAGIDVLNGSGGSFAFPSGVAITNPSGTALFIDASAPTMSYAGSISSNSARPVQIEDLTGGTVTVSGSITATGQGILVQNNISGTPSITFSGTTKSLTTGTNAALTLFNNDAASVVFSGGNLAITTTSGAGFAATDGGTVTVTGADNVVSTGSGTGVSVQNTTIGGSGLSFRSVSSVGAPNGIILVNTGSNGLQVTGNTSGNCGGDANPSPAAAAPYGTRTLPDAADCSGGTINGTSGADGSTSGVGVYLENAANVSLTRVRLTGTHQNFGIRGTSVSNLTLDNVLLDGTFGNVVSADNEGGVNFINLSGAASVANSSFSGAFVKDFQVRNTSALSLNRITIDNVTFGTQTATNADDHLLLTNDAAGTMNATVQNSRFMGAKGDMFQFNTQNGGIADLIASNNVFYNQASGIASGGGGVNMGIGGTSTDVASMTYSVTGNRFRGASGVAFGVQKGFGTGTAVGTVSSNIVGDAAVANSGSSVGGGMYFNVAHQGKHKVLIASNQISQYNGYSGLEIFVGGVGSAFGARNGSMHATIRSNTITSPGNATTNYVDALHFEGGTNGGDAYTTCLSVGQGGANVLTGVRDATDGSGITGEEYSVTANNVGVTPADLWFKLAGYPVATHTPTDGPTVDSVLGSANGGVSGWIDAANSSSTYSGNNGAGVACDLF